MQFFSLYKLLSYSSKAVSSANFVTLQYSNGRKSLARLNSPTLEKSHVRQSLARLNFLLAEYSTAVENWLRHHSAF